MKNNYYIVTFENGITVFVSCFNEKEAKILAKEVVTRNGFTRDVRSVKETTNVSGMVYTDFAVCLVVMGG